MPISVELSPEQERLLGVAAENHGVDAPSYVRQLIESHLSDAHDETERFVAA